MNKWKADKQTNKQKTKQNKTNKQVHKSGNNMKQPCIIQNLASCVCLQNKPSFRMPWPKPEAPNPPSCLGWSGSSPTGSSPNLWKPGGQTAAIWRACDLLDILQGFHFWARQRKLETRGFDKKCLYSNAKTTYVGSLLLLGRQATELWTSAGSSWIHFGKKAMQHGSKNGCF